MSAREFVRVIGEAIGLGRMMRAHYAAKFGTCRRCDAPLGGESPEQICEPCHVDEILQRAGGPVIGGDA